jgi:4'-phosphopantetheinyl transferase
LIGVARNAAHVRIGVDVERIDRRVNADRLAHKFLTADEARLQTAFTPEVRRENFLRYWTCKEAMSKATGDGLIAPFRNLSVELAERPRLIAGPPPYVPESWRLHAVAVPSGYVAALAVWTFRRS